MHPIYAKFGWRIQPGKDHVPAFLFLLVGEPGDSIKPVAAYRDDAFAYHVPLRCQRVKAYEHVIGGSRVAEGTI
jgi:hypothetical protein